MEETIAGSHDPRLGAMGETDFGSTLIVILEQSLTPATSVQGPRSSAETDRQEIASRVPACVAGGKLIAS